MSRIVVVAGARPNFMKVAPLVSALSGMPEMDVTLVHTGQHYDEKMSGVFFGELGIPCPDLDLEVGSGSHARQTAEVMKRFEPVLTDRRPERVVVVGDVNSTLACALTAVKMGVSVAHVEAGLRSFDMSMPEEINRRLTDVLADLLFVSEPSGLENLKREGVPDDRVFLVGNVMIDTLLAHRKRAGERRVWERYDLAPEGYALLTLHRPSNVDDPLIFGRILEAIEAVGNHLPVLFPAHPRTRKMLAQLGRPRTGDVAGGLRILEPLGYLDFLCLLADAKVVLTDSGGIQEETTALGVPCLTLRENTERPVTVHEGTNTLVGRDPERILAAFEALLAHGGKKGRVPELWDGRSAERIAGVLATGRRKNHG